MTVVGGTFHGHLFENPRMGVPRDLYWALHLDLPPSDDEGAVVSVSLDWLTFPVRDARRLAGLTQADLRDPSRAECSAYREGEHVPLLLRALSFAAAGPGRFAVALRADGTEGQPHLPPSGDVAFEGLVVIPENLSPAPVSAAEASAALAAHADLSALNDPTWDRFRYLFRPRA